MRIIKIRMMMMMKIKTQTKRRRSERKGFWFFSFVSSTSIPMLLLTFAYHCSARIMYSFIYEINNNTFIYTASCINKIKLYGY